MKVLFCITDAQIARCFEAKDLARLEAARCEVLIPHATSRDENGAAMEKLGADAEVWITGWGSPPLEGRISSDHPPGLIIHAAGSIKGLKPEAAFAQGVRFVSCNQALAVGVAETALGMIIGGVKGLFFAREWTARGGWGGNFSFDRPHFKVRELYGLTIGIVGASKVGRHLVQLLKAFEVRVLVADPFLTAEGAKSIGVTKVELPDLFSESDVISIHAPFLPATTGLVTEDLIKAMKDNAILINTARGAIIDEPALIRELETQRISAILDVTATEPPAPEHPLRSLPNVVLTPHLAGAVSNGCLRIGRETVDHVLAYAAKKPLPGEVRAEQLAILA